MSEKPDGVGNWCPGCGEMRELCRCGDPDWEEVEDYDSDDVVLLDINRCPDCGEFLVFDLDYVICPNLECGYSVYIGDDTDETSQDIIDLGF